MQPTKTQLTVENLKLKKEIKKLKSNHLKVLNAAYEQIEALNKVAQNTAKDSIKIAQDNCDLKNEIKEYKFQLTHIQERLVEANQNIEDLINHNRRIYKTSIWKLILNRIMGKPIIA